MIDWMHDLLKRNCAHHAMLRVVESNLLASPEEWAGNQHTQTNQKRSLTIWIANDAYGFALYDGLSWSNCPKIALSYRWRKRLWRAWCGRGRLAKEKARQVVARFAETPLQTATVLEFKR